MRQRDGGHADDVDIFLGERYEKFRRPAVCHRFCDFWRDFSHHRIRDNNADRSDNHIDLWEGMDDGILAGGAAVGLCFQHLCGCNGIRAEGDNFNTLFKPFVQFFNDDAAYAAALPVDNTNSLHHVVHFGLIPNKTVIVYDK